MGDKGGEGSYMYILQCFVLCCQPQFQAFPLTHILKIEQQKSESGVGLV